MMVARASDSWSNKLLVSIEAVVHTVSYYRDGFQTSP